ncbi:MAG: hypothetical protein RIS94_324 [Pseudomonadota bacterium]
MILGAVLAGGQSTRFGSDKALAELDGRTLIARAVEALESQCDAVVVVGRTHAPAPTLPDWPAPGMGPLAGLAAALHHARDAGYDMVLSCAVDSMGLTDSTLSELAPAPAYCENQPVIGLWPASASATLDALLESDDRHSMKAFAARIGARPVALAANPTNINTPADLKAAQEHHDGL